MATKKANGEGSINRYKNGWRATITIGRDENGKLIRKQFYGKTKLDVINKMTEYRELHNRGLLPKDDKITLGEWFYIWLFEYRVNDLKPSSFERYESIFRTYIKGSQISNIKLKDLRTSYIQSYYNVLVNEHKKSTETIKTLNKYLKACLNQALKENYIPKNYCTLVTLPKNDIKKNDDIVFLTAEEQGIFISSLEGNRLKAFFLMAIGTGLRLGELISLTWEDIDLDNNSVSVNKNVKKVRIFHSDGTHKYESIVQDPKTNSSIRTTPIPKNIISSLKEHKLDQNKEKLKNGKVYIDNNLVFCTPLGTYLDESNIRKQHKKVLTKANIPYKKFHSLRHTYATRLFEANIPVKTVQVLMGHSDIQTTMNIYTHVVEEVKSEAIEKLNMIF